MEHGGKETERASIGLMHFFNTVHPAIFDGIQAGFCIIDRQFRVQVSNKYLHEWLKRTAEELRGQPCFKLFHQRDEVCQDCPATRTFQTGETSVAVHTGLDSEGGIIFAEVTTHPVKDDSGETVCVIEYVKDVSERLRLEEQIRRRNNELEVLHAVDAAVCRSLDLDAVLEDAMDSVLQVMGLHPRGGIFLLDESRKELHMAVHRGLDKNFVERERRVRLGECLCGHVAQSGRILYSPDSTLDERHSRPSAPEPHAHIIVPLISHDQISGVLFLYPPSDYKFTLFEERLFSMVGRQIGIAIENARLYQRADEQLRKKVVELTDALDVAECERARAREAVELREEFLSVASHELKTPMTSLRGFVQLATRQLNKEGQVDPERIKQALNIIDLQSEKLSRLISQLLDISRIDCGQLALEREVIDVAALVKAAVRNANQLARRHTLVMDAPSEAIALADPLRLEQVITNLIDNGIKYSPDGGQIDISVTATNPDTVLIAVTDRGIGISPEHRGRVFDRFYQAHAGGHFGGLGLGLYISREIVELHGGRIELEVPDEGGTRFTVVLPTALASGSTTSEEARAEAAGRILVVDDDEAIVRLVSMTLSEEGYEVMEAPHGVAALEIVERWQPDVILLDLRMPLMDGREFARIYRQTPGPHSPIVLVTAAHDTARPVAEIGVEACLEKPFDLDKLLDVVGQHARRAPE